MCRLYYSLKVWNKTHYVGVRQWLGIVTITAKNLILNCDRQYAREKYNENAILFYDSSRMLQTRQVFDLSLP